MHNAEGEQVWERSLDTFGKVKHGDNNSCPFMYQGQYYDAEIELAYNRFRYYDPEDGRYISVDPIGLLSGEFNLYNYVDDSNSSIDALGLDTISDALALNNAMDAADIPRPDCEHAAHHMVSSNDDRDGMKEARNHMSNHGVDVNDAENGVFLKRSSKTNISNAPELKGSHPHSWVHTKNGRQLISQKILAAQNKKDIKKALKEIRKMHLTGDPRLLTDKKQKTYKK